ncbi:hypothetical protein A2U01_0000405 [Trifolium medium]|uniref:Transposase (putative) gypsy type domain-containing protein n=1 Tax=Trifolium medium TaxID=97028 RepID=A0A392LXH0_9FABA|nr:hypothetical protein [Trifolium medium]
MADEEVGTSRTREMVRPTEEDPYVWVAEKAKMRSLITNEYEPKFTIVEDRIGDQPENWAAYTLKKNQRVYSKIGDDRFAMYEFVFEKLGFRMTFSEFAMGIFDHLRLAPSQLNPNFLVFIRAYELVCEHLEVVPSVSLFFTIFQLQRKAKDGRQCWVSLKSKIKLFDMFVDSVRGFKPKYYLVRAVSEEAKESLFRTVVVEVDGEQVSRHEPKFPLAWTFDHFLRGTDFYLTRAKDLSEQDRAGLKKLVDYVGSFKAGPCVYRESVDGRRVTRPLLDKEGKQVFEARYINTRELLSAKNAAVRKILLDQMANQGSEILRMLTDQKKRKKMSKKGVGSARSSAAGGNSSGSPRVDSPTVAVSSAHQQKRLRPSPDFVDLELKTMVPQCWEMRGFLEKYTLEVVEKEKRMIREMTPARREEFLVSDIAGLMRLVSTALVLNEDSAGPGTEVTKLQAHVNQLKTRNLVLDNKVADLEGKRDVWIQTQKELRETDERLRKAVEENDRLKAAMAPGEKEDDFTRGASTRVELVKKVELVLGQLTEAAKMGFDNAVAQLEVLNPRLRTTADEEDADGMEQGNPDAEEPKIDEVEGQGESG